MHSAGTVAFTIVTLLPVELILQVGSGNGFYMGLRPGPYWITFIPRWVKVAVALALGLGTMVGWERIVVTVGEKIRKQHLSYAQGAAADRTQPVDGVGAYASRIHRARRVHVLAAPRDRASSPAGGLSHFAPTVCQRNPQQCTVTPVNPFVTIRSVGISTAFPQTVKRLFSLLCSFSLAVLGAQALRCATLERLTLPDMISKSTAIVRATVGGSSVSHSGPVIYTHFQLNVTEWYKGAAQSTIDLALPGGVSGGIQQVYSGVPQLHAGDDYVFFLWTGKSGLTQIIGLSQGLFAVSGASAKDPALTRAASHETMLDHATGRQVQDQTLRMTLSSLKSRIKTQLAQAGGSR